jgi:hypothetical protein
MKSIMTRPLRTLNIHFLNFEIVQNIVTILLFFMTLQYQTIVHMYSIVELFTSLLMGLYKKMNTHLFIPNVFPLTTFITHKWNEVKRINLKMWWRA